MPLRVTRGALAAALLGLAACTRAVATPAADAVPEGPLPLKLAARPTVAAITPRDLMSRVYLFADDSMGGRLSGSAGDLKATAYIESELRRIGLEPAGENGSFFQHPLFEARFDSASTLAVDGRTLTFGRDAIVRFQPGARSIEGAQVVYGGIWNDTTTQLSPEAAAGKIVVVAVPSGTTAEQQVVVFRSPVTARFIRAAGIAIANLDVIPGPSRAQYEAPASGVKGAAGTELPAYFHVTSDVARAMLGLAPGTRFETVQAGKTGGTVRGAFRFRERETGARNVIAVLRGADPALRNTYVAIGSHSDHVGFRRIAGRSAPVDHDSLKAWNDEANRIRGGSERALTPAERAGIRVNVDSLRALRPARPDSIYNGADDDASGSMAMLEVAEQLAAGPRPARSVLLVWHTAEESGLLGAQYFTASPTVPRDSIVAQLNIDMIGRGTAADVPGNGGPAYLQLIGSRRLSTELGDLIEAVNARRARPFRFDYEWDRTGHPEQIYCRSDHYEYAKWGIPVTFFSTGGHGDYHQVTDEPQYIDYRKLADASTLVHDVALALASRPARPVVDKPKPDPRGVCVQ
jgi:hypothetical protein